jgi:hypothetical protein
MTIAKRKAEFCKRVKAVRQVQTAQASEQQRLQARQTQERWALALVPRLPQQDEPLSSQSEAGQGLEHSRIPAPKI